MNYQLIKEKVYSEINIRSLTDTKIYGFVFTLLKDEHKTDSFLLDDNFGGFTPGQLNRAKARLLKSNSGLDFLNIAKQNNKSQKSVVHLAK